MADQINVTWKAESGGKKIFQDALDKWAADKPKSMGNGDFILDLIRIAENAESAIETNGRLEALGIKELVEMHKRRAEADARMLEQIADLIGDAQGKAEAAVKIEMDALRKSKEMLEMSIQKITTELEKTRQELEAVRAESKEIAAGKAESDEQCKALLAELADAKTKLEKSTLASDQLANQLEREKLATIALKENAVKHESQINAFQKAANDAEAGYRQKIAELERQLAKSQGEREQAELAHRETIYKAEREKGELESSYKQEILKLEAERQKERAEANARIADLQATQAKAQLEAESRIERLQGKIEQAKAEREQLELQLQGEQKQAQAQAQENGKDKKELEEARIKIASLEATVKGQQENLMSLTRTLDVMGKIKAEQKQENTLGRITISPKGDKEKSK